MAVVFNGENVGVAIDRKPALQDKSVTITENTTTTYTADEGYDGLSSVSVTTEVPQTGTNGLQWKCDNVKSLAYEFFTCPLSSVDEAFVGLDSSQVTTVEKMFASSRLTTLPFFDTSNVTNMINFAQANTRLTTLPFYDLSNVTDMTYAFNGNAFSSVPPYNTKNVTTMSNCLTATKITTFPEWNFSSVTSLNYFVSNCSKLVTADVPFIPNSCIFSGMFSNCSALTDVSMDLLNASSVSYMLNYCQNLTNLNLKNIKLGGLQIGSGTSWGHLLTVDSLVNTIKELWDNSSSTSVKTLTIGTANKEKLANVYVKLVDITDEMRAEDEYIDNKKPCVVCESTDEGAMLIEEYAVSKNWALA